MPPSLCLVLQLIKSQKVPNKLVIMLETEKEKTQRKEYVFSDSKVNTQCFLLASLDQVGGVGGKVQRAFFIGKRNR